MVWDLDISILNLQGNSYRALGCHLQDFLLFLQVCSSYLLYLHINHNHLLSSGLNVNHLNGEIEIVHWISGYTYCVSASNIHLKKREYDIGPAKICSALRWLEFP